MANKEYELKVARVDNTMCRFYTGRGPDKQAENKQLTGAFGLRPVLLKMTVMN